MNHVTMCEKHILNIGRRKYLISCPPKKIFKTRRIKKKINESKKKY